MPGAISRDATSARWTLQQARNVPRWTHEWWYELSNIPSLAIATGLQLAAYAVLLNVASVPFYTAMGISVFLGYLNEFHTMGLAIIHRDLSRFNQPETWERTNGKWVRMPGYAEHEAKVRAERRALPLKQRLDVGIRDYWHQYWRKSKRMPCFVVEVLSTASAFTLVPVLHASTALAVFATYGFMALQNAPEGHNAYTALRTRSWAPFNKPMIVFGDDGDGPQPVAPARELVGLSVQTTVQPIPAVSSMTQTLAGEVKARAAPSPRELG